MSASSTAPSRARFAPEPPERPRPPRRRLLLPDFPSGFFASPDALGALDAVVAARGAGRVSPICGRRCGSVLPASGTLSALWLLGLAVPFALRVRLRPPREPRRRRCAELDPPSLAPDEGEEGEGSPCENSFMMSRFCVSRAPQQCRTQLGQKGRSERLLPHGYETTCYRSRLM
jgi:hypothetical protein